MTDDRTALLDAEVLVDGETVARMLTSDRPPDGEQVEFLLDVLVAAPDEALDYVTGQVECHTARGGGVGPLMEALRSRARGRLARATVAFVAARAAEGAGDSETAKNLVDEVLGVRPDLVPARHDAAGHAAARGDYFAADAHLNRAGSSHPLRPGLREVLVAVEKDDVPRNSPCPCGSGRKFKVCCRRGGVPPLGVRAQLLYALVASYAERAPRLEIVRRLAAHSADPQYLMFCLDLALFPGGLVEPFLAARGHWLRADERDLVEGWCAVPVTLYEAVDVRRGDRVTLRALPDGEPFHLADRMFSTCAQPRQLFCGRVLDDDTSPRMLALPVAVPPNAARMCSICSPWLRRSTGSRPPSAWRRPGLTVSGVRQVWPLPQAAISRALSTRRRRPASALSPGHDRSEQA